MKTVLRLKAIDKEKEYREFSCELSCMETAFEILNTIVRKGDILLEASIVEEQKVTRLPAAAFTGESFEKIIRELQQEWEEALSKPVCLPNCQYEYISLLHRRLEQKRTKIAMCQSVIDRFDCLIQRAKNCFHSESTYSAIINSYKHIITKNQTWIFRELFNCTLLEKRIQDLSER